MKNQWNLFSSIFIKRLKLILRYPLNFFSSIITIYLIFLAIFLGSKYMIGSQATTFSNTIEGIIVGFFVWTYAISGYSTLSWGLMEEAQTGTLEQLYMSPFGFGTISIFIVISDLILNVFWTVPFLFLMMVTTGKFLHLDLLTIVPLLVLLLAGAYGIGFIMGGLGLIYKRIQSLFQILQFVFVGFIAAPVDKIFAFKFLPLSLGTKLIRDNMTKRISIFNMPFNDIFILIITALFYFLLGFYIFKLCEKIAKDRGLLGHY